MDATSHGEATLAVIVPAYNEEKYLPSTVAAIKLAINYTPAYFQSTIDVLVVDNNSTDKTSSVATSLGCRVIVEPIQSIARARNAGASAANSKYLMFVDADTLIPASAIATVLEHLGTQRYIGGAFLGDYRPRSTLLRMYLKTWEFYARQRNMVQGFCQFCTSDAFRCIGGYDERLYMGEDNDFFWRLSDLAHGQQRDVVVEQVVRVSPSSRRFDKWPLWKTLLWTNPIAAASYRRSRRFWRHWYGEGTPR